MRYGIGVNVRTAAGRWSASEVIAFAATALASDRALFDKERFRGPADGHEDDAVELLDILDHAGMRIGRRQVYT
jgi:hypothetical protein